MWKIEVKLQFLDGVQFSTDFIRFYLHGHANLTGTIYTLMCSESDFTVLKKNDCILNNIKPDISFVGFEEHEISLPRINNISYIHHLVLDYYSFSDKFSFFDIRFGDFVTFSSGESLTITTFLKNSYTICA